MANTNRDGLRLNRRTALKALTLSAAAVAAGAGVTDVIAAGRPTLSSHPDTGLVPKRLLPNAVTPPVFGTTYQMFAGSDFHARTGKAYTFNGGTGVAFAPATGDYFVMPVNVPKGSQITECECYFVNADTGTFFLEMQVTDPNSNSRDVANNASSSTVTATQQLLRIAPITGAGAVLTDPSRYGIELLAGNGGAAVLLGARIGYVAGGEVNMLPSPIRLLETRTAYQDNTPGTGQTKPGRQLNSSETFDLPITGRVMGGISVPAGAKAVIGNVTVTGPLAGGYLTLFPRGGTRPNVSTINYNAGVTIANGVIVGLDMGGFISIYVYAQTHVLFDVTGYVM